VQSLAVVPQRTQAPGQVRPRHDLVVFRAPRLQYLEALADCAYCAVRVPEQYFEPLDIARDVPLSQRIAQILVFGD
jgi:hypothetical protein